MNMVSGGFLDYTVVISGTLPGGYVNTQTVSSEGGTYTFSGLWAGDYHGVSG